MNKSSNQAFSTPQILAEARDVLEDLRTEPSLELFDSLQTLLSSARALPGDIEATPAEIDRLELRAVVDAILVARDIDRRFPMPESSREIEDLIDRACSLAVRVEGGIEDLFPISGTPRPENDSDVSQMTDHDDARSPVPPQRKDVYEYLGIEHDPDV